jgi:hypothetical protein
MSDNDPDPPVNGQILDAVKQTNRYVYAEDGNHPATGIGTVYANTIAYPKVSQAAAFAVQDATDYLRNIMTMSATAQGVIFKLMVEHKEEAPMYFPILQQVQASVTAAQENLKAVGTSAAAVTKAFDE